MKINAVIENKDGGTLVLDFPHSIYDVYEKLQSVGIRQSPHQITLSDEDGDDVRVKLYSEDEIGKHLLLTLKEQNTLADANMLAFMVDNAKPDFRSKLEQNLLHDQYGSMQEVTDAIKQMLYESGPVKAVFYCPLVGEVTDDEGFSSPVDGRFLKSYVWGTYGQVLTRSLYKAKAEQYPDEVGGYADFIEEHWIGGRTADCVGLIKGYGWFNPETGKIEYGTNGMPDIGADTMYANAEESGTIDTIPEIPGLAVWHEGHIGIYIGSGQVIHASGTKVGVIQTPIGNSGWTHWLKIPYITYYDNDITEAPNEKHIWDVLYAKIGNSYGVAGLMGNLYAESGLQPNNLQNSYEESLGYSDSSYTQAVDNGSYTNFTSDSAGYGLAQWTVEDRKTPLLAFANARGCSIADLDMQLAFLCDELETKFPGVLSALKNAKSVREASDYVLFNFEAPLDQSEAVQAQRAANGSVYYSRYGQ